MPTPSAGRCPKCQRDALIKDGICNQCGWDFKNKRQTVEPNVPNVDVPQAARIEKVERSNNLVIRLVSSAEIVVSKILLYDQISLDAAIHARNHALSKFEGVSTGIGFCGNLSWVLSASAVLGVLENAASAVKRSDGMFLLKQADILREKSRKACYFFSPSEIDNSQYPIPGLWQAMLKTGHEEYRSFIHNEDPNIIVRTQDNRTISIIWDKVESLELRPTRPKP